MNFKIAFLVVVGLLFAALATDLYNDPDFMALLAKPQMPNRFLSPPKEPFTFQWTNCGSSSDPTYVSALAVSPDPIVLGQNITVSFTSYLSQAVTEGAGFGASVAIYKSILGVWVYIPCIDGVGSCAIADVCTKLKPNPNCPLKPWGVPCSCPFQAKAYSVPAPGANLKTHDPNLSWLTDGDYQVQGTLFNPAGQRMACYQITASLGAYY